MHCCYDDCTITPQEFKTNPLSYQKLDTMNKRILFFIMVFLITSGVQKRNYGNTLFTPTQSLAYKKWTKSHYLNTKFLAHYNLVSTQLKCDGFSEGFFSTADGLAINYLYLNRPQATATIIFCCGFLPGRKEGLASFHALLSDNYNILFFDARGHGKSEGSLITTLWAYGQNEYKDVLGAINFAKKQAQCPIIILGMCAGAYHAARALIHLEENNQMRSSRVTGLVFDSGWGSVIQSSYSAPIAKINDVIAKQSLAILPIKTYRHAKSNLAIKAVSSIFTLCYSALHTLFLRPIFSLQDHQTNLFDKIHTISIPIFFIHSYDDEYVPIADAQKLALKVLHKKCWWIQDESKHGCHHLKHSQRYMTKLTDFFKKCI